MSLSHLAIASGIFDSFTAPVQIGGSDDTLVMIMVLIYDLLRLF